tara:strand:+ start:6053 stop:6700 length:648 start_codon:yes stop_codon:yes gene_type:complete
MLKAVLWDNDGVLVDTEHLYYQACREVLLRYEIPLDEESFIELFLRKSEGLIALLSERGLSENLDIAQDWRNRRYTQLLSEGVAPIEGIRETLILLKPRVQMGIVTSSRKTHFDLIHSQTGVLKFFDFVLAREDYVASKPDPEPYLQAMIRNDLMPDECIVVEDSPRGLQAANAAGLRCVVIPRGLTCGLNFEGAWMRIKRAVDLIPIVESLQNS